jgi:DNA-binding NarL/FixJ family response regulator
MPKSQEFSDRELEVARLVAQGLTNKEAGERLFVTATTIKNHLSRACQKAYVETRTGLIVHLIQKKILNPHEIELRRVSPIT